MKLKMPAPLKQLLTETDNHTYDIVRILALFAMVEFMVKAWTSFDPVSFGQGFGFMIAGLGVALGFKPETKDSNVQ